MRPTDLPPAERYRHGTRARYVSGCRCAPCRAANSEYARYRAKVREEDWNGLVDAGPARRHLQKLSAAGVGYKTVADACDVGRTTLAEVMAGRKLKLRARTAKSILAVTAASIADHALVDASPLWRRVKELQGEGFSKAELARRLGFKREAIQFGKRRVLARTVQRVERFYQKVMN